MELQFLGFDMGLFSSTVSTLTGRSKRLKLGQSTWKSAEAVRLVEAGGGGREQLPATARSPPCFLLPASSRPAAPAAPAAVQFPTLLLLHLLSMYTIMPFLSTFSVQFDIPYIPWLIHIGMLVDMMH